VVVVEERQIGAALDVYVLHSPRRNCRMVGWSAVWGKGKGEASVKGKGEKKDKIASGQTLVIGGCVRSDPPN